MSNVLGPIVARYSLFFTLVLSDSSRLARSKHPRQVAQELVLQAHERFQTRHHANAARKLRALIRNVSTASSSSTKTRSSTCSASSSSSMLTARVTHTYEVLSPCPYPVSCTSSFPTLGNDRSNCNCASRNNQGTLSSILDAKASATTPLSLEGIGPLLVDHLHHANGTAAAAAAAAAGALTLPSPPPSPLFQSSSSTTCVSSLSSIHCSSAAHDSAILKLTRRTRIKAHKIAYRRQRNKISSITTLLSITLTVILLSLLQNRRHYLKKRGARLSQHQLQITHHHRPSSCLSFIEQDDQRRDQSISDSITTFPSTSSPASASGGRSRRQSIATTGSTSSLEEEEHELHYLMIDQSKGEYISSWLKQQGLQDADDNYEDNIEYEELSYLVVDDTVQSVDDLDHRHHYDDQHGLQFQHLQQNCSELIPINASQSICHRRTFSMMNPDTFTSSCSSALQQHKQEHRHLYQTHDLDYNPDLQLHQYRIQHYPYIDQHVQIHSAGYHRRYMSVPMNFTRVDPSLYAYGPPIRPAHELAWERHNYYKRLQYEEERMVLRMHQQKLEQQCQRQQYSSAASSTSPSRLSRHCPQDPVARTGSLNRLAASPSLLSADTSRVLGLCRSNTLSKTCKRKSTVKKESAATTAVVASSAFRGSPKKTDHDAIEKDMITETIFDSVYYDTAPFSVKPTSSETTTTMTTTVPSTSLSLGRLGRKKTLKEHLTPPLRSLARRCSTRFGGGSHGSANGSGSRPKSFSGARSDPIVECPQGRRSLGSRSGAMASAMMIGGSGHMCDFKPLQAGPETTEMLKQNQLQQEAAATATTTTGQGSPHVDKNASDVPVHRKVTLLRSKTTRASSPAFKASFEEAGRMVARTETLPYGNNKDNKVNKNNSLRLANGRGLNFSTSVAPPNYIEQQLHGMTMDGGYLSTEAETEADDTLEHESMRKQIVAILSLGRKDLRRRSSSSAGRSRNASTPALSSPSTSSSSSSTSSTCPSSSFSSMHCLSPLAVEAQEDLYPVQEHEQEHAEQLVAKEDEMGIEQEKPFDKSGSLTAGHSEMQEDPCEKIVFMLVPKSRYEFQPLVVR